MFFFLKVLLRGYKIGLRPIYIDESGFFLKNSNFKNWCENSDKYYSKVSNTNIKLNLLMAVSEKQVIYYKISEINTSGEQFLIFMKDLIDKMDDNDKKHSIFIMDNLSSHLTLELFQFYFNNDLKVLFTIPYKSTFNMIEKVFRHIKNNTYKKIYGNKKELLRRYKKNH